MKILTDEEIALRIDTPMFRLLSQTADAMGFEAYIVGGYVRDMMLERPSKDIDVVVVGSPAFLSESHQGGPGIALAREFSARLGRGAHLSFFENFGTAQVKWHHTQRIVDANGEAHTVHCEEEVEFVGARRESYSRNSRKPIVEDGSLHDDQLRRDFTINAMGICLNGPRFGELVDPFDGVYDLEDRLIVTPLDPDITFSDDPLRMLRCIRFATQLNFHIEEETFEALGRNAERIKIISQERISTELNKIMAAPVPSIGFVELQRCGLLALILPEVARLDIVEERNGRKHKNNFYHTLEVLDNVARQSDNLWLRWGALLHDIGKPASKRWDVQMGWTFHNHNFLGKKMVKGIFHRLKLPLDERLHYVEKLVDLHMRPINIADDEVTDSAVRRLLFDAGDDIDDLMVLCEADITSKNAQKKKGFLENYRLVRQKLVDLEEKDRIRNFQPPVDGAEIMRIFQIPPSREVGMLKTALKDAILDGIVPNEHDAALEFIKEKAREMGLHDASATASA